jgi:hypothetical protein
MRYTKLLKKSLNPNKLYNCISKCVVFRLCTGAMFFSTPTNQITTIKHSISPVDHRSSEFPAQSTLENAYKISGDMVGHINNNTSDKLVLT